MAGAAPHERDRMSMRPVVMQRREARPPLNALSAIGGDDRRLFSPGTVSEKGKHPEEGRVENPVPFYADRGSETMGGR